MNMEQFNPGDKVECDLKYDNYIGVGIVIARVNTETVITKKDITIYLVAFNDSVPHAFTLKNVDLKFYRVGALIKDIELYKSHSLRWVSPTIIKLINSDINKDGSS